MTPAIWVPPTLPKQIRVATSVADMKDGVGSYALAVIAPKAGPINVSAGTPVVVVAKHLMDSPTIKKFLRVIYAAWIVLAGYVGIEILRAGSVYSVDWRSVGRNAVDAAVVSVLAGYGISLKKQDNDPTVR